MKVLVEADKRTRKHVCFLFLWWRNQSGAWEQEASYTLLHVTGREMFASCLGVRWLHSDRLEMAKSEVEELVTDHYTN
jgi:hypothetical protein